MPHHFCTTPCLPESKWVGNFHLAAEELQMALGMDHEMQPAERLCDAVQDTWPMSLTGVCQLSKLDLGPSGSLSKATV